ncbi:MAG TPA: hypothetical protein VJV79_04255 [Polyangiaceae bacterium]|nr:hypothetical protein [Polyangiaceae bacterium]
MMHPSKTRASVLGAALLVGLATFGSARTAQASLPYTSSLQKALNAHFGRTDFCVPLCTACHNTTKGGPQDLNVFGRNLWINGPLPRGYSDAQVAAAVEAYFDKSPPPNMPQVNGKWDSDADGFSDEDELAGFDSPSLAGPIGEDQFCPDITYGCGARIAAAPPPVDRLGLFSAGLVVLGLAAFRRLKRAPRAG